MNISLRSKEIYKVLCESTEIKSSDKGKLHQEISPASEGKSEKLLQT